MDNRCNSRPISTLSPKEISKSLFPKLGIKRAGDIINSSPVAKQGVMASIFSAVPMYLSAKQQN